MLKGAKEGMVEAAFTVMVAGRGWASEKPVGMKPRPSKANTAQISLKNLRFMCPVHSKKIKAGALSADENLHHFLRLLVAVLPDDHKIIEAISQVKVGKVKYPGRLGPLGYRQAIVLVKFPEGQREYLQLNLVRGLVVFVIKGDVVPRILGVRPGVGVHRIEVRGRGGGRGRIGGGKGGVGGKRKCGGAVISPDHTGGVGGGGG